MDTMNLCFLHDGWILLLLFFVVVDIFVMFFVFQSKFLFKNYNMRIICYLIGTDLSYLKIFQIVDRYRLDFDF